LYVYFITILIARGPTLGPSSISVAKQVI